MGGVKMKNSPNMADVGNLLPVFRTTSMVLVESPDRTSWSAMSLEAQDPTWKRLAIPPGTTATRQ